MLTRGRPLETSRMLRRSARPSAMRADVSLHGSYQRSIVSSTSNEQPKSYLAFFLFLLLY